MRDIRKLLCFAAMLSLPVGGAAQAAATPHLHDAIATPAMARSLLVANKVDAKPGPLRGKPTLTARPAEIRTAMMTSYTMCIVNMMIRYKARGGRLHEFPLDMAELLCMPLD